ncbi:MAG: tRNA dihydrouridine synthase DusB [Acidimicrobiales bacterium]
MPLRIGPFTLDSPVVLAPMAGVTNPPFRILCRELDEAEPLSPLLPALPADRSEGPFRPRCLYVSEMVTARGLVEGGARSWRLVRFAPNERPRSAQLYGVDPATIAEAVRRLIGEVGVEHIDLNFGCPVPKVTRKGGGAALPLHHVLLGRIIGAAVRAAALEGVPVTVKFRLGVDEDHSTHLRTGAIAAAEGAAAVALHARTAAQHYSGHADWSAIAALKAEVRGIPVLGNGDIWTVADAKAMLERTGCDGVVIGRGCLGRPWFFRDLTAGLAGRAVPAAPTVAEVAAVMARHVKLLAEWLTPEVAVRDFRKHVGWYLTGYPVGPAARTAASSAGSLSELLDAIEQLASRHGAAVPAPGDEALPRGKSGGPRRVVLPDGWLETCDDPSPPEGADLLTSGG